MRLVIEHDGERLFELDDANALTPTNEDERAAVFVALTQAMSVLARVRYSPGATGDGSDPRPPATSRCPEDRKTGQIVLLAERRGIPA
jgi:hypothetical protein